MLPYKDNYHSVKIKLENLNLVNDSPFAKLLRNIKQEYETFIKVFEDASDLHLYLNRQTLAIAFEKYTNRNLTEYKSSLNEKIELIREENNKLQDEIAIEEKTRLELLDKHESLVKAKKVEHLTGKGCTGFSQMKLCQWLHLSPEQWIDKAVLQEKLKKLVKSKLDLEKDLASKFVSQEYYKLLLKKTLQKESECEAMGMINNTLKLHVKRLKLAVEAAEISAYQEYTYGRRNGPSLGHVVQTVLDKFDGKKQSKVPVPKKEVSDLVDGLLSDKLLCDDFTEKSVDDVDEPLQTKLNNIGQPKSFEEKKSFNDDDPLKEQEAELTMDYIEQFSLLFTAKKYEEAAVHAAYSPKGILRIPQTMKYFKHIDAVLKKKKKKAKTDKSYLLHYCKLLMSSIEYIGKQPSSWETIESFKCALAEGEQDLVEYWIAKDFVAPSETVGFLLRGSCTCLPRSCKCKYSMLAEVIFRKLQAHHQIVDIMLHQGRFITALSYAVNDGEFSSIDFARLLEDEVVCAEFLPFISTMTASALKQIIIALVSSDHKENAVWLAKKCSGADKQLKFCYDEFADWDGNVDILQGFISMCRAEGLEDLAYEFATSALLKDVIQNSRAAMRALSN